MELSYHRPAVCLYLLYGSRPRASYARARQWPQVVGEGWVPGSAISAPSSPSCPSLSRDRGGREFRGGAHSAEGHVRYISRAPRDIRIDRGMRRAGLRMGDNCNRNQTRGETRRPHNYDLSRQSYEKIRPRESKPRQRTGRLRNARARVKSPNIASPTSRASDSSTRR